MDTVIMIVKNLMVLAFLTLLLELFLPKGSTKKYAKFVMGLLVIVVMVNPVLRIIGGDVSVLDTDFADSSPVSAADIVDGGEKIQTEITKPALAEYEKEITERVKKELGDVCGMRNVVTEISLSREKINTITLVLQVDSQFANTAENINDIRSRTENLLAELYGIQSENVVISISRTAE